MREEEKEEGGLELELTNTLSSAYFFSEAADLGLTDLKCFERRLDGQSPSFSCLEGRGCKQSCLKAEQESKALDCRGPLSNRRGSVDELFFSVVGAASGRELPSFQGGG